MHLRLLNQGWGLLRRWGHAPVALPHWRLYWNQDPGWRIECAGIRHDLDSAHLLLIAPETVYRGIGRQPARHLWLHIALEDDSSTSTTMPTGIQVLRRDRILGGLIDQLTRHGPADPLAASALFLTALSRVPRTSTRQDRSPVIAAAQTLGRRFLHRSVSNREMAAAAGCHPHSLNRTFQQELGVSPHQWHLRCRIDAACRALEEPGESLDAIAERFGFCDRHHFTRVFTRLRCCPPAAFRRQLRIGAVSLNPTIGPENRQDAKSAKSAKFRNYLA